MIEGILRPIDIGYVSRIVFVSLQMEYCEKSTLRDTIDEGLYQDVSRLWRLFREILDGLAYIHEQVILFLFSLDRRNSLSVYGTMSLVSIAGNDTQRSEAGEHLLRLSGSREDRRLWFGHRSPSLCGNACVKNHFVTLKKLMLMKNV